MQEVQNAWNRAIFSDVVYDLSDDEDSDCEEDVDAVKARYATFIANKRARVEEELAS
ncbi:hypothetical protein EXIGLDRAFT_727382 [Exidia glandulosa HHB12029]|uniref:Uncharacterized protein n=1 Tax=Exidia glandulosa HHB12029 TaxID=1314781 RepID=A0A165M2I3_EXIGL|nr:hypothetical protein EXIGLDRAFT_727382 [Exidia glandulosa HHB12029]